MKIYMEFIPLAIILSPFAGCFTALLSASKGWQKSNFFFWTSLCFIFSLAGLIIDDLSTFKPLFSIGLLEYIPINFSLGLDYVSLSLVIATTLIFFGVAWIGIGVANVNLRKNLLVLLFLEGCLLGVFLADDLIIFYVFWELVMIGALLIFLFNSEDIKAILYLFIYTLAGSLFMLAAIIALYVYYSNFSSLNFDAALSYSAWIKLGPISSNFLWVLLAIAFAIKTPLFPFHSWQPPSYNKAPTFLVVIMAALISKMGWYGFYRFNYKLIGASVELYDLVLFLSVIGVLYGALLALLATDIKRVLAYSSMSHLSLMIFGLFSNEMAVGGSLFFVLQHTLIVAGLFWSLQLLEQKFGKDDLGKIRGLFKTMPWFSSIFVLISFANIGLPGLSGFVGEFIILSSSFRTHPVFVSLITLSVILAGAYQLKILQNLLFGSSASDRTINFFTSRPKLIILSILSFALLVFGFYPGILTELLLGIT